MPLPLLFPLALAGLLAAANATTDEPSLPRRRASRAGDLDSCTKPTTPQLGTESLASQGTRAAILVQDPADIKTEHSGATIHGLIGDSITDTASYLPSDETPRRAFQLGTCEGGRHLSTRNDPKPDGARALTTANTSIFLFSL